MKKTETILDEILSNKEKEVMELKKKVSLEEIALLARESNLKTRRFREVLQSAAQSELYNSIEEDVGIKIIAEIKKASPSGGIIRKDFDHIAIAKAYQNSGLVNAISVLTDEKYFSGRVSFIKEIKEVTTLPILRKDFIIDEYQVYESFLAGADAILLIVAALDDEELSSLVHIANSLGMDSLVEVHSAKEIMRALGANATCIGVNSRNLQTFNINKDLFHELLPSIPNHILKVAESGIENFSDVQNAQRAGVQAVLIGSSIMKDGDIIKKLTELKGGRYGTT